MRENSILAILFADIVGSTRLYEKLGDAEARRITSACVEDMSRLTKIHGGRVVKTIGDEVMCTFPTANKAARAAVAMHESVSANSPNWGVPLNIRVGFHYGEVILENNDVFGDAVNLAARMAAQAKADQIITTGESIETLDPDLQSDSRLLITTTVKGKLKPVQIFEITWGEAEDLTIMGGFSQKQAVSQPAAKTRFKVRFQTKTLEMTEELALVTMGRGQNNHFMVPDIMASRLHAKIEMRRGKFFLVDLSTNGTYVLTSVGKKSFLHRDELMLEGTGVIGLGKEVQPSSPEAVHFQGP